MKTCININKIIELINSKKTTLNDLCKFIFSDTQAFYEEREKSHLAQFKLDCQNGYIDMDMLKSQDYSSVIFERIQTELKRFSLKYAINSIDEVLDAINQNKFKSKMGYKNLLVLLTSMKELNEED